MGLSLGATCLQLAVVATVIKFLLVPTYRSTDFEVHRNWLAITHSLPISKWYVEATSEWTLDYPPFFAWFEWTLSQFARLVDPAMLQVRNLEYASQGTILFQRGSVIVTDAVLLAAAFALSRSAASEPVSGSLRTARGVVLFLLLACNAGLLIVDHVHFQYNGFLMGVLLWSLHAARSDQPLLSGLLFAVLLNLKHLFLYAGPLYFVLLLRHYCFAQQRRRRGRKNKERVVGGGGGGSSGGRWTALLRLGGLGGGVLVICAASFGPFIAMGQTQQVLRRLFPFGRGLLHAYWAGNAWAPYAAVDKVLAIVLPRLQNRLSPELLAAVGLRLQNATAANMAGGLVGISRFAVLPQITPAATAAAVLLALTPCLAALWAGDGKPGYLARTITRAVSYSFLCGFVFGYHVHEKAVLVALLPLAVDSVRCRTAARRFLLLSTAGHYGLLPLLFRPQEYAVKILLVLSYFAVSVLTLKALHAQSDDNGSKVKTQTQDGKTSLHETERPQGLADRADEQQTGRPRPQLLGLPYKCYLAGFLLVELYGSLVYGYMVPELAQRLPFVPLMLTSVYCSLGVLAVWLDMAVEWSGEAVRGLAKSFK